MKATIHSDGGSRGNPGEAAIGVTVELSGKKTEISERIGIATNNVAEYRAIIKGLETAIKKGAKSADCFLDSELVVKQLRGEYRIKDEKMKELAGQVALLRCRFENVLFFHIPREKNKEADALVNRALDNG